MITSSLLVLIGTLLAGTDHDGAQGAAQLLLVEPATYDFGRVPLTGGDVTTRFVVTNRSNRAVRLSDVYTSCGCTTVKLQFSSGTVAGPFGMPGHELPIRYDRELQPGERIEVQVRFDPAAHGPQGVGRVTRTVVLKPVGGRAAEFTFTATVF